MSSSSCRTTTTAAVIGSSSSKATAVVSSIAALVVVVGTCFYIRTIHDISKKWEERRNEERTGRIRAEVKLRSLLKRQQQQQQTQAKCDATKSEANQNCMVLKCIGIVASPYTKRMGTPRQGALVPSSRGYIDFASLPPELLDGIESYSHLWILFGFHANTDLPTSNKTKVRPPRAGGMKVGQLATRSPHRPNPMGLSLVKFERYDRDTRRLYISSLDLVHGTPVYDIKPCVPWDIPGFYRFNSADGTLHKNEAVAAALTIPSWVAEDGDVLSTVVFTPEAHADLQQMVDQNRLAPFYTATTITDTCSDNDEIEDGVSAAKQTLQQVLAQDPRSSHKGVINQRGSASQTRYRLVFGSTEVCFVVLAGTLGVQVVSLSPVDFCSDAYVDGIPLVAAASTTFTNQD